MRTFTVSGDESRADSSRNHSTLLSKEVRLQEKLLAAVSRTFALTIPRLPSALRDVVANAYLLCRILDTIEDEVVAECSVRTEFYERFNAVLAGHEPPSELAADLLQSLSATAPAGERELILCMSEVVAITSRFRETQQQSVRRCVRTMSEGMCEFGGFRNEGQRMNTVAGTGYDKPARTTDALGLADLQSLERYCYHVAGVVGEMLTEFFCEYSPAMAENREELMRLSVSFGNGLQLTNILKDIYADHQRGYCWLPRSVFGGDHIDLDTLLSIGPDGAVRGGPRLDSGVRQLVGLCRTHLDDAVRYTSLIPTRECGLRVFCLWSIGMAFLTLRQVYRRKASHGASAARISRTGVNAALVFSALGARHDTLLLTGFGAAGLGLPSKPHRNIEQSECP